ncbi:hypothetical protein [Brevibacillus sp. MER 51]|uniref:hypothetical protein n=1 Tax=Brevibacillus sp. MER 51 TaxID=2939560 RepID=UPI0020403D60|nr:hypothetical protein [Brevibacillus sp. MER 51]
MVELNSSKENQGTVQMPPEVIELFREIARDCSLVEIREIIDTYKKSRQVT